MQMNGSNAKALFEVNIYLKLTNELMMSKSENSYNIFPVLTDMRDRYHKWLSLGTSVMYIGIVLHSFEHIFDD